MVSLLCGRFGNRDRCCGHHRWDHRCGFRCPLMGCRNLREESVGGWNFGFWGWVQTGYIDW
jgi:hypothetical protein